MTDSEADDAALRLAFNNATETYPRHLAAFLSRDGETAFREWWGQFYAAVRDHRSGLILLAELQLQKELIEHMRKHLLMISQWDCLNPPNRDLCADHPWLRQVVDAALADPN